VFNSIASRSGDLIVPLHACGLADINNIGGKNASLGEMIRELQCEDIKVPEGFATTSKAYQALIGSGGLRAALKNALSGLNCDVYR
jgi:pyruvate,water dikinase